ncbi:ABC transporter permease [Halohasta litorea]|uniref:ABC transporter permease n=1 Tax=Halohasta litorea TaxID=869891 RepID=A0ABD6DC18_9EURY|nr:ABC transporter permease [Halohasta litorea]
MTTIARIGAEARAASRSFLRRRTAVFFTFGFPLILVGIFGAVVGADPTGSGLFGHPTGYYVPGYLSVIVLFTPLTRVGSSIARHRDGRRFEKLATTPLNRFEWLAAHIVVNAGIILAASVVVLAALSVLTDATTVFVPLVVPFVVLAVVVFCGLGAVLGRVADSQDGVVAASNAVALPMVFLSETFVAPELLPAWFRPLVALSPLTYFARGVRAVTYLRAPATRELLVLAALAGLLFVVGGLAVPQTEA